jgi:hypothetical protein
MARSTPLQAQNTGDEVIIKGQVKKAFDSSAIPNVNLIRFSDAQGTATDQDGRFRLRLPSTADSFILSAVGYGRTVFDPPDSFTGQAYRTTIYLSQQTYGIKEVVIEGNNERTLDVDLSMSEGRAQEIANEQRMMEGFGYNIQGAASSIYNAFNNKAERRAELKRLKKNKRNIEYLSESPYRAYIKTEFGLTGKALRSFLQYCNFDRNYRKANYYEVTSKLDQCYTLYYNKVLRERQRNQ